MKITLSKEQLKEQNYLEVNTGKISKQQAEVIARIIYELIEGELFANKNDAA